MFITTLFGQDRSLKVQHKGNYRLAKDWPNLPTDSTLGQPSGLGIDSHGHLIVFHRAGARPGGDASAIIPHNTLAKLDAETGQLLRSWGAGLFVWPHGLSIDQEDNIWVTDVELHQVFKFSPEGKLLMTLGEAGIPGDDALHFNKPTDVAVAKDGSFYVGDGYGNSRVVKFSPSGKYLFEWGGKGIGNGQFNLPHALAIDKNGNVLVADRENARIQKFDASGKFLKSWKTKSGGKVYSVKLDKKDQSILAVDYLVGNDTLILGSNITVLDADFQVQKQFGRIGLYKGPVCRYHDIEVDDQQNIYVADLLNHRLQKFRPVSDKKHVKPNRK